MYESVLGLTDRPFVASPVAGRYFPAAAIEGARQTIARCIERAEGVGLVVGAAGSGKSILCQVLANQFRDQFLIALLSSGRLDSRRALLQAVLFELGLQYRGMDEGELRLSLFDYLASQKAKIGLLLIGDDAHRIPMRMLEEIHQLTNLVTDGRPRVRAVLVGSPLLEEHLGNAKLESLNQRIVSRCYLQSFQHDETVAYVRHAIVQAGGKPDELFTADAIDAIHRATEGIPRLVIQLCDHALLLACAAGRKPLSVAGVEEAWADLQQLPTRWNAVDAAGSSSADIIEFGTLDNSPSADRIVSAAEPKLHAVAADEEILFTGEPVQRIERIQGRLESIDEQFEPAGTIGPEVEIVFSAAELNPFHEPFAEEEVIVDPFAGSRPASSASAPVVRSTEGSEIASILEPHQRSKPVRPSPASTLETNIVETRDDTISALRIHPVVPLDSHSYPPIIASIDQPLKATPTVAPTETESRSYANSVDDMSWQQPPTHELPGGMLPVGSAWIHPSEDPVMPEDQPEKSFAIDLRPTILMPRHASNANSPEPHQAGRTNETENTNPIEDPAASRTAAQLDKTAGEPIVHRQSSEELNDNEPDDADLIVVEEDPSPQLTPKTSVRRQEYRQLFARLRRG